MAGKHKIFMFFAFFVGVFLFYAYSVFVNKRRNTRWEFKRARNHLNRSTYSREKAEKRFLPRSEVRSRATPNFFFLDFSPLPYFSILTTDIWPDVYIMIFKKKTSSFGGRTSEKEGDEHEYPFFGFFVDVFLINAYVVFVTYSWSIRWGVKWPWNGLDRIGWNGDNGQKTQNISIFCIFRWCFPNKWVCGVCELIVEG